MRGPLRCNPINHAIPMNPNIEARFEHLKAGYEHHENRLDEHDAQLKEHKARLPKRDNILQKLSPMRFSNP